MGGVHYCHLMITNNMMMALVSFFLLTLVVAFHSASGQDANLVLLHDAPQLGAVCLDGTPPGYYFKAGSSSGAKKWILFLQGGGWCYDETLCLERSKTSLGSSSKWPPTMGLGGILSGDQTINPDFYQWNVAYIKYCDGASFAGDVKEPLDMNGTKIYFRGFKILNAVLDHLKTVGLKDATEVILSGCSAGGLATYLHADFVQSTLEPSVEYHAIADAGYFIDAENITGQLHIRSLYKYVYNMQNCKGGVNQDCVKAQDSGEDWKCFFAQYTYPHIKNPIFSLNSQVDTWQLGNILQLGCTPPNCNAEQMRHFENFYEAFKKAEAPILASRDNGGFLDSCLTHCHAESDTTWVKIMVNNQSIRQTFSNWYFTKNSGLGKVIDCAYPCNKSCR